MRSKKFYTAARMGLSVWMVVLMACFMPLGMAFLLGNGQVLAAESVMTKEDLNIVFAVDHSGSMNKQDEQRMISQMIKVFADTMHGENVRIGYVAYNDTIVAQRAPVSVQNAGEREMLKETVDSAKNRGETDIGLGLREAYHLMDGYSGRKMIVLISDGETDLEESNTGRTEADSMKDIQEVIRLCQEEGTPIVTVAFGEEYKGETATLADISEQTKGESYSVLNAEDLIHIFYDLFHTNFSYTVQQTGDSIYGEGSQRIHYEVGANGYEELTVLLLSDKKIEDADIVCNSRTIKPQLLGTYAVAGLLDAEGTITIQFETGQKQRMAVFLIGRRNIIPVVEWPGDIYKNRTVEFQIYFTDQSGQKMEAGDYSEQFEWYARFRSLADDTIIPVEMEQTKQGLKGTVKFAASGDYSLYLETGRNAENAYEADKVHVLNTLPDSKQQETVEMLTVTDEVMINLKDYFSDADGDTLTYQLMELPQQVVAVSVEGHFLHVKPQGRGMGDIVLLISDGEGSLMGHVPVRVKSLPEIYWPIPLVTVCILAFIIVKIQRKKKKVVVIPDIEKEKNTCYFTGKINAYFTLLPEGMEEIPPLTFALHHIREGKIVIGDMFKNYQELIGLLELDHVFLYPAENRKIIIYHNSKATVMIGSSIVCRKMQYAIGYGNVIYITSQDGSCELEVHYISTI